VRQPRVRAAALTEPSAGHSPLVHSTRQSPPPTTRADNPIATITIMLLTLCDVPPQRPQTSSSRLSYQGPTESGHAVSWLDLSQHRQSVERVSGSRFSGIVATRDCFRSMIVGEACSHLKWLSSSIRLVRSGVGARFLV